MVSTLNSKKNDSKEDAATAEEEREALVAVAVAAIEEKREELEVELAQVTSAIEEKSNYLENVQREAMKRLGTPDGLEYFRFANNLADQIKGLEVIRDRLQHRIHFTPHVGSIPQDQRGSGLHYIPNKHHIEAESVPGDNIGLVEEKSEGKFFLRELDAAALRTLVRAAVPDNIDSAPNRKGAFADEDTFKHSLPKLTPAFLEKGLVANGLTLPEDASGCGEMFFQQTAYSPLAMLFMAAT